MIIVSDTKCLCQTDKYTCPELEQVDTDVGYFYNCIHPDIIEKYGRKVHIDSYGGQYIALHDCPYRNKNEEYIEKSPLNDELIVACEIFYHNIRDIPVSFNDLKKIEGDLKLSSLKDCIQKLFDNGMLTTEMGSDESGNMERKFVLSNETMWMIAPLHDKYYRDRALLKVDMEKLIERTKNYPNMKIDVEGAVSNAINSHCDKCWETKETWGIGEVARIFKLGRDAWLMGDLEVVADMFGILTFCEHKISYQKTL